MSLSNMNIRSLSMSQRSTKLDSMKFFLICLVLLGHNLKAGMNIDIYDERLYAFIYSFHMPLFVFISGYVTKKTEINKFYHGGGRLVLIYLMFSLFYLGNPLEYFYDPSLSFTMKGLLHNLYTLYTPSGVLWYLLSLIFWRLYIQFVPTAFLDNIRLNFSFIMLLAFVSVFIPLGLELSFQKTFAFFPYFIFGFYDSKYKFFERINSKVKHVRVISWIILMVYLLITFAIPNFPIALVLQYLTFWDMHAMILLRVLSYFWVFPLIWAVMNLIPEVNWWSEEGKHSLFYYIFHVYIVYMLFRLIDFFHMPISLPFMFIYTIFGILLLFAIRKFTPLERVLNLWKKS